ncbi:MAG: DUF481 domain-containing protein [Candidatus Marinimicrobia bacterium]|nr:DUF481 domain-containing protein [Candidatus Neomarinimicrobiota bacterium]
MGQSMQDSRQYFLMFIISMMMLGTGPINAQVNTESLRKTIQEPGFHFNLGATLNLMDGNRNLFQTQIKTRFDQVQPWGHLFLVSNYKMSSKDETIFVNQGFAHLRFMKKLTPGYSGEVFSQLEFNEFIRLSQRTLVGAGLRFNHSSLIGRHHSSKAPLSMVFGLGLMLERESIDVGSDASAGDPVHGDLAELLRSSNYFVLAYALRENVNIQFTTYYQVDTKRIQDYRLLSQSLIEVGLGKRLALTSELNIRYDSEAPGGVKARDLEYTQGLTFKFK